MVSTLVEVNTKREARKIAERRYPGYRAKKATLVAPPRKAMFSVSLVQKAKKSKRRKKK